MIDPKFYPALFEIAANLNREFALPSALRAALGTTIEVLDLDSGWIWLVQPDIKSVYLAATYNLPPALGNHPERLSGWCFCIETYLSNDIAKPLNISEVTCSRLKNIKSGDRNLKFHSTIPITIGGKKAGLINLLTRESQKLEREKLELLQMVSQLIAVTIQRTRIQNTYQQGHTQNFNEIFERVFQPRVDELIRDLDTTGKGLDTDQDRKVKNAIELAVFNLKELEDQFSAAAAVGTNEDNKKQKAPPLQYPASPLTKRELEVLHLVREGLSNRQIASQLYLSERTIKFHITSILSKLIATNRTEAINNAIQRGILN